MISNTNKRFFLSFALCLVTLGLLAGNGEAQNDDVAALKAQGQALVDAQKYTEALPIYEKLAKLAPKDPVVFRNLGASLLGQSAQLTEDQASKRTLRIRARQAFITAKSNGEDSLFVQGMIDGIPADGGNPLGYSDNAQANKLMEKAESMFSSGKLDDAFRAYQEALKVDPNCYYAALFSGDAKLQAGKIDEAGPWYDRAIAINPYIETAYRYSATPLMRQNKYEQARDRYIEAYIVAPYDRLALSGLVGWGQITKTPLGHPKIDIPQTKVGADGRETTNIIVSPDNDGSVAWIAYSATRENWKKEKFVKTFPGEPAYRHTLAEEVESLRSVVKMAKDQKPKTLNPQIATLAKLDQDGLLEAFILIAVPDSGIARDHPNYLRSNREQLRQYVMKYVIGPK
ncbi:MAG: tetratricopeptide repeat protein [Pyrinomonadaceae bacterium]